MRLGGGHSNSNNTSGSSVPKRNNLDVSSEWEISVAELSGPSGLVGSSGRDGVLLAG